MTWIEKKRCEAWMPPYHPYLNTEIGRVVRVEDEYSHWRQCKSRPSGERDGHAVCGNHRRARVAHWEKP